MKVKVKDKKKEKQIIFVTIFGMILVLIVWSFQLNALFTDAVETKSEELSEEYADTIEELQIFRKEIDERIPEFSEDLDNILNNTEQVDIIDSIAEEAVGRLQESQVE